MQVNGIGQPSGRIYQRKIEDEKDPTLEQATAPEPANADGNEPSPTESEQDIADSAGSGKLSGVVRLLMDGHFKGVADVRLRINHAEKLAALEHEQLAAVAGEKVNALLTSVGMVIETLGASEQAEQEPVEQTAEQLPVDVPQLQEIFTQTVNQAKDDFVNGTTPSKDALVENLNNAFEAFVESLQALLTPVTETTQENEPPAEPAGEESTDTTEPTEPIELLEQTEPQSAYEAFLEELRAAFTSTTAELTEGLNSVNILPELSQPKGNGVAYEKFLAIYNEL